MSLFNDPRPFYAIAFTSPVAAPPVALSVPSNTERLIIRNADPVGGDTLSFAIFDTFGVGLIGAAGTGWGAAVNLAFIEANPIIYLQQIGRTFVPPAVSIEVVLGPEGARSSLCYVGPPEAPQLLFGNAVAPYQAVGYVDVAGVVAPADNITINALALTAAAGPAYVNATGTITALGVGAADTVTLNTGTGATPFAAVVGAPAANQFQIGGTDIQTATNLVAAINDPTNWPAASGIPLWLVASNVGGTSNVVTLTAPGLTGNAVTMATTDALALAVSGPFMVGGNGPPANQFPIGATATVTAANIVIAINDPGNAFAAIVTAASGLAPDGVTPRVTITSILTGMVGQYAMTSSVATILVISGAALAHGAPDRYVLLFQGLVGDVLTEVTLIQGRGYTGP